MPLPLPDWLITLGVILICLLQLYRLNGTTDKEWNDRYH